MKIKTKFYLIKCLSSIYILKTTDIVRKSSRGNGNQTVRNKNIAEEGSPNLKEEKCSFDYDQVLASND